MIRRALLFSVLSSAFILARAEEVESPKDPDPAGMNATPGIKAPVTGQPVDADHIEPSVNPEQVAPPPLFPGDTTPPPPGGPGHRPLRNVVTPPEPKPGKPGRTEKAEQAVLDAIRYRKARTAAEADPAVQQAMADARIAPTPYERRQDLKRYYKLLFDRMAKLDGRFPALLNKNRNICEGFVAENRIAPSVPPDYTHRRLKTPVE